MRDQRQNRLQALDGLRAISILLVVISHAWLGYIVPGGLGVTIFFFISGFIITRLMLTEWDKTTTVCIRQFYLRRLFRLMPALIVFVLISLLTMHYAEVHWKWAELSSVFFYFANYYGIFFGFSGDALPPPLAITWSLAVEEHFYLVFPILFLSLIKSPRLFLKLILAAMLIVLAWRLYLGWYVGLDNLVHYRIYKATDTRFDSILYGTAFSILIARYSCATDFFSKTWVFLFGILLMLATLLFRDEIFRETLRYSLQGIALACMFFQLVLTEGFFSRILASRAMVYIGRISYSLYLYHWLAYAIVSRWMPDAHLAMRMLVMGVLSFLSAHLSYRYIEQTFLKIGKPVLHTAQS